MDTRVELGVVVGRLLADQDWDHGPRPARARALAAELGWDLGEAIDLAAARVGDRWVWQFGLSALDDRTKCDICGAATTIVSERMVDSEPYVAHTLACGHTVI